MIAGLGLELEFGISISDGILEKKGQRELSFV
jgi:hypothetical protein